MSMTPEEYVKIVLESGFAGDTTAPEPARIMELEQQLAAKDALLRQASEAFRSISLCEFNSMSSRQEMGRLARDAVAAIDKELK